MISLALKSVENVGKISGGQEGWFPLSASKKITKHKYKGPSSVPLLEKVIMNPGGNGHRKYRVVADSCDVYEGVSLSTKCLKKLELGTEVFSYEHQDILLNSSFRTAATVPNINFVTRIHLIDEYNSDIGWASLWVHQKDAPPKLLLMEIDESLDQVYRLKIGEGYLSSSGRMLHPSVPMPYRIAAPLLRNALKEFFNSFDAERAVFVDSILEARQVQT